MKAIGTLLLYYFTWRSLLVGTAALGLLFIAIALKTLAQSPYVAFSFSMLAYVCLLVFPYLSAPWALRYIIGSRGLAMVPRLPLAAGSALLLLAILTAVFLPLASGLIGISAAGPWLVPRVFVVASLYAGMVQLMLTSERVFLKSIVINVVPLATITFASFFGADLLALWNTPIVAWTLPLLALAGWIYAMRALATRRNFKPVFQGAGTDQDMWIAGLHKLFRANPDAALNPAGTLLLATPASIAQRLVTIGYAMVFTPLLSALVVQFTDEDGQGPCWACAYF